MKYLVMRRNRFGEFMLWLDSPAGSRWVMYPITTYIFLVLGAGLAGVVYTHWSW